MFRRFVKVERFAVALRNNFRPFTSANLVNGKQIINNEPLKDLYLPLVGGHPGASFTVNSYQGNTLHEAKQLLNSKDPNSVAYFFLITWLSNVRHLPLEEVLPFIMNKRAKWPELVQLMPLVEAIEFPHWLYQQVLLLVTSQPSFYHINNLKHVHSLIQFMKTNCPEQLSFPVWHSVLRFNMERVLYFSMKSKEAVSLKDWQYHIIHYIPNAIQVAETQQHVEQLSNAMIYAATVGWYTANKSSSDRDRFMAMTHDLLHLSQSLDIQLERHVAWLIARALVKDRVDMKDPLSAQILSLLRSLSRTEALNEASSIIISECLMDPSVMKWANECIQIKNSNDFIHVYESIIKGHVLHFGRCKTPEQKMMAFTSLKAAWENAVSEKTRFPMIQGWCNALISDRNVRQDQRLQSLFRGLTCQQPLEETKDVSQLASSFITLHCNENVIELLKHLLCTSQYLPTVLNDELKITVQILERRTDIRDVEKQAVLSVIESALNLVNERSLHPTCLHPDRILVSITRQLEILYKIAQLNDLPLRDRLSQMRKKFSADFSATKEAWPMLHLENHVDKSTLSDQQLKILRQMLLKL